MPRQDCRAVRTFSDRVRESVFGLQFGGYTGNISDVVGKPVRRILRKSVGVARRALPWTDRGVARVAPPWTADAYNVVWRADDTARVAGAIDGWGAVRATDRPDPVELCVQDGGVISYVLIAMSMAAGLVIRNLLVLRMSRIARGIVSRLEELLAARNLGGAIGFCREPENACFVSTVMESAIGRGSIGFGMMEFRAGVRRRAGGGGRASP